MAKTSLTSPNPRASFEIDFPTTDPIKYKPDAAIAASDTAYKKFEEKKLKIKPTAANGYVKLFGKI